jgi:outer membrane protein OmpA-like peptidoglycan-associated protein
MYGHHFDEVDTEIDETGAWLSIGDLMSGLLMIFALLLILALLQLKKAEEESKQSRIVIIQSLQETLTAKGINAEVDPQTGDISIMDSLLFDNNESVLKPDGVRFLDDFIPLYSQVIFSDDFIAEQIQHVIIEGHTSMAGSWDYNMSLSLNRANSVSKAVNKLVFGGKDAFQSRLLVAGRGETEADQRKDDASDRKVLFRFQFKNESFPHWLKNESGLGRE